MFWQMLPSKEVDEVGDTAPGSIGPTLAQFGHSVPCLWQKICLIPSFIIIKWPSLSLSRQEKRWLLRRSTENQATIKTEHAKTPSHLHNTTGRFNFQGMQNVIDLINSDNKTSADSHVLCIRPQASLWQGWEAGATLQCHWCCYLCQSPVPGSHSCIQTSDWSAIIRCQPPLLSTSQRITALVWAVN